jgi:hypothetical protein
MIGAGKLLDITKAPGVEIRLSHTPIERKKIVELI